MSGRVSPFAALTGAEKQIKWLEVQSVRLPYVEGALERAVEPSPRVEAPRSEPKEERPSSTKAESGKAEQSCIQMGTARLEFQKTRHQQYDAVIERMKQAEKRISMYKPLS